MGKEKTEAYFSLILGLCGAEAGVSHEGTCSNHIIFLSFHHTCIKRSHSSPTLTVLELCAYAHTHHQKHGSLFDIDESWGAPHVTIFKIELLGTLFILLVPSFQGI